MNIQRKVLLITGMALVGGILLLYVMLHSIVSFGFRRMEEAEAIDETIHAVDLIIDDLNDIERTSRDYASWSETYAFLADGNTAYVEENLVDSALANLQVNVMLFVRPDHSILRAKGVDLATGKEAPVAPSLLQALAAAPALTSHPTVQSRHAGVLSLPEGPLLLVSLPVLTNDDEGPVRGSFVAGRFISARIIERINHILGVQTALWPIDDPGLPPDFRSARLALATGNSTFTQPIDESRIAGYTALKDMQGHPAFIVRVIIGREIWGQGQATLRYALLSLVAVSVIFSLMTAIVLKVLVLSRLRSLSAQVREIGCVEDRGDAPRQIVIRGNDELSDLARIVNGTFLALSRSEMALRKSNQELELRVGERTADLSTALAKVRALELFKDEVIRKMLCGICTFEPGGRVTLLNPVGAAILGNPAGSVGLPLTQVIGAKFAEQVYAAMALGAGNGSPHEFRLDSGGSRQTDLIYAVAAMRDQEEGQEEHHGIISFWDVTQLRRAQAEIRRLERIVSLGEVSAQVAHELRNPLTVMYSTMQSLEKTLAGEDGALGRIVLDNIERMETIIRRMSLLSRNAQRAFERLDLRELADAVLTFLEATLRDTGIVLRSTLAPGPLPVTGDPAQLHQALLNLLMNAVQAMPGGGELEVTLEGMFGPGDGIAIFSVADRGKGVDPADIGRIFDPFFTTKARGTGLGLAITERIVRSHGGTINFANRAGGGTVFSIELPWAADPPQEA